MAALLDDDRRLGDIAAVIELGLQHEQQHQELLVTDLKYNLGANPLRPPYRARVRTAAAAPPLAFVACGGGLVEIGHAGPGTRSRWRSKSPTTAWTSPTPPSASSARPAAARVTASTSTGT